MKQLFGYILVKETNVGIPHVVVVAHDVRDVVDVSSDKRSRLSIQQFGRRLGSVLTDRNGRFSLTTDDLEFQGNEARPNLLVAVFAPEDIQNIDNPMPLSPEERLLFVSNRPRSEAGAEEAFVIRILQAQLDRFHISLTIPAPDAGARVGDSIESAWNASGYLKSRFQDRIKVQVDSVNERRKQTKEVFKNFSAIPLHLRNRDGKPNSLQNNDLLIPHRRDLPEKLPLFQSQSLKEGLKRLHHRQVKPVVRVYMTRAEMRNLNLQINEAGHVTGEIRSATLIKKVRASMSGFDLIKTRGISNPSVDELRRRYLLPPKPATASAPTAPSGLAAANPPATPVRAAKTKGSKSRASTGKK